MIRVHPSALDGFQYYLDSELSTRDFIYRLCRLDPRSSWASAGTALHTYIEYGGIHSCVPDREGELWDISTRHGLNIEIPRPQVSEFRMAEIIEIDGEPVILSGIADGMIGNRILEWKAVKRMGLEKFIDSWQWRCYLSMDPRFTRVEYHVFQIRIAVEGLIICDHKKLTVQSYKSMRSDLMGFIGEYVRHIKQLEEQGLIARKGTPPQRISWVLGPEFHEWDMKKNEC